MMSTETESLIEVLGRFNGNGQYFELPLPKLIILTEFINDVVLANVERATGLEFVKTHWLGYEAQPTSCKQIVLLIVEWNFKTRYYNNGSCKNELYLKFCGAAFEVDHVCIDCAKKNSVRLNYSDLGPEDRISLK